MAVVVAAVLVPATLGTAPAQAAPAACADARAQQDRSQLTKARDEYLKVLSAQPEELCARDGLIAVNAGLAREEKLCAEAKVLDKGGKADEADERYAAALRENVGSECAKAGLGPAEKEKGFRDHVGDAIDYLPKIPEALGSALVLLGALLLAWYLVRLRRRASLTVKAFTDGGVAAKVGAGFGALVEERLLRVVRKGRRARNVTYDLDLVSPDIELIAEEEDLAEAVGSMAEIPQLQIVVAMVAFIDRLAGARRLAVGGELLPQGDAGHGVAIALFQRNAVQARAALWEQEVKEWMPLRPPPPPKPSPGSPPGSTKEPPEPPPDPRPYYRLAAAAASWGQYETARALHKGVEILTGSGESFALTSLALERHREGKLLTAAELYTRALDYDRDNVAALVNLAAVLTRISNNYFPASVALLIRAEMALRRRHDVARFERRRWRRLASEASPE